MAFKLKDAVTLFFELTGFILTILSIWFLFPLTEAEKLFIINGLITALSVFLILWYIERFFVKKKK